MNVLFVDDEVQVLRALERMIDAGDVDWEPDFAEGGEEALAILADQDFDAIVTDMRMPGMDGAELLKHVCEDYPAMVRIVLSGQADRKTVMRAVEPMHQYLSKPCEAAQLKSTISRACAMRETLQYEGLRNTINTLPGLPSLPTVYTELSDFIKQEDFALADAGNIIEQDIAMTAKVLQLVNSAAFGLRHPVSSPAQAASILGLETLKALVLTTSVFAELDEGKDADFSLTTLMDHSLEVAAAARKIAKLEGLEQDQQEEAFTAGMLHDIGKLLLATADYSAFAEVRRITQEDESLRHTEAERRVYGADHAAAGAYLLDLWGLPQSIVEVVALHHRPEVEFGSDFTVLSAVWAANLLCHGVDDVQLESNLANKETSAGLDRWREACMKPLEIVS
ncbi:MAG: response regulator [Planctomycetaceae bacterium]